MGGALNNLRWGYCAGNRGIKVIFYVLLPLLSPSPQPQSHHVQLNRFVLHRHLAEGLGGAEIQFLSPAVCPGAGCAWGRCPFPSFSRRCHLITSAAPAGPPPGEKVPLPNFHKDLAWTSNGPPRDSGSQTYTLHERSFSEVSNKPSAKALNNSPAG